MIATLCALVFMTALVIAAIGDAATMTIPNRLTLVLAAAFIVLGPFVLDWQTYAMHLGAGAAMLAAAVVIFALGWAGGGDAKLFAATALWMGWTDLPSYLFITALAGGALTLTLIALRNVPLAPPVVYERAWVARLLQPKGDVPYGVALAIGGVLTFPQSVVFAAALAS